MLRIILELNRGDTGHPFTEPETNRKGRKAVAKDREVNSLRNFAITLGPSRLIVFGSPASMI